MHEFVKSKRMSYDNENGYAGHSSIKIWLIRSGDESHWILPGKRIMIRPSDRTGCNDSYPGRY